jgi:hypothetical protein
VIIFNKIYEHYDLSPLYDLPPFYDLSPLCDISPFYDLSPLCDLLTLFDLSTLYATPTSQTFQTDVIILKKHNEMVFP